MPDRKMKAALRKTIHRSPRLEESALLDVLEEEANHIIGNYRKMRVELGRIFIRIKSTLKRGEWERYYAKTFGTSSVSFRSAERYMVLAAKAKADSLSCLKPGASPESEERDSATAEVVTEIDDDPPKPRQVYRLALHLSVDQRNATIRLWKSRHRPRAERKVVAVLDQLKIKFGALKNESEVDEKENR